MRLLCFASDHQPGLSEPTSLSPVLGSPRPSFAGHRVKIIAPLNWVASHDTFAAECSPLENLFAPASVAYTAYTYIQATTTSGCRLSEIYNESMSLVISQIICFREVPILVLATIR